MMTPRPAHFDQKPDSVPMAPIDLDAELARFEREERARLGLPERDARPQWQDPVPQTFLAKDRPHTTLLVSGLTMAHDLFIRQALRGLGYKVEALDCPDTEALRFGKEFGNRGQCNPTYFTVGNLIKHLTHLRDAEGLSSEEITKRYLFVTAGACGPCRFGTYVTEYRKALRDSGFPDFRVLLFQQQGGLKQATGEEVGLEFGPSFFLALVMALFSGDVLNALGYRIRPYELEAGATDRALDRCKQIIGGALERRTNILLALLRCRRELAKVKVDRTQVKPKVAIIGEFWAMTTEGDGNYHLPRFLEAEGAEVDVQLVTAWVLYNIWEVTHDTKTRADLRGEDHSRYSLAGVDVPRRLLLMKAADLGVRVVFQTFANLAGLHGYHLPDLKQIADISHRFYDNSVRGGEGHMEVGKLILNVLHNKVNMTLSVKPFGCMPSSGVSDGVQTQITELYPQAIFCPIETSGDGKVNVQSRVQMMLFKAKQAARREADEALADAGLTLEEAKAILSRWPLVESALFKAPHRYGSTAADALRLAGRLARPLDSLRSALAGRGRPKEGVLPEVLVAERRKRTARLPIVNEAAAGG